MHKTRWAELSPVLDELLDLDATARAQRLAQIRSTHPDSAAALHELLSQLTAIDRDGFLAQPAPLPQATLAGHVLGGWTIEREIGQGGMGTVWLARRSDGRFEGVAAVKVLNGPLHGRGAVERFEREGRILGRLAHPHIARLIDAGFDGTQPYLILEHVDGQPIDAHCDTLQLGVTARVRLFLHVLAAVAHAHARLTLHRDLKPSNILVTAAGDVKLLDFGIAKLLDDSTQGAAATELTQRAGNAFTPRFAAPEQIEGHDVTTATDVYALGVLLFLLLAGRHPTEPDANAPSLVQLRALIETVPPRLSDVAPAARARELRGDLDTIVAKALKKAPAERYANAALMAEDLQRWLVHEPIAARPDATWYRLVKYVRRHRVGAAAGALVLGAAAVGVSTTLWQSRLAQQQRVQAEGLIEFMLGDLRTRLQPVGRLDVLDAVGERALAYYGSQSPGQLDAAALGRRARALHLIGEMANLRGNLDEAARIFTQAADSTAELLQRHPGDGQRLFDHAQSVFWTGYIDYQRGQLDAARQAFERYRDLAEQLVALAPGRADWEAEVGMAYSNLGTVLLDLGRPADALQALRRTHQVHRALLPQRPALAMEFAQNLGWMARAQERLGRYDAALDERRQQIDFLRTLPDLARNLDARWALSVSLGEMAHVLADLGRVAEARATAEQRVQLVRALVDADPQNMAWLRNQALAEAQLAELQAALGQGDQARVHAAAARALAGRQLPRSGASVDAAVYVRGIALAAQARAEPAAPGLRAALQELVDGARSLQSNGAVFNERESLALAQAQLLLGDLLARDGDAAAAARQWQAVHDRLASAGDDARLPWLVLRAHAAWRLGDRPQAQALARRVAATPYRHPVQAELEQLMHRATGAAGRTTSTTTTTRS